MCLWILAKVLGAVWAVLGAMESVCSWSFKELFFISCLQSYLLGFLPKSCLAKLFLKLLHGTVAQKLPHEAVFSFCMELCKSLLPKLFLKLLRGTVVQMYPFEAILLSSCLELSSKHWLAKLSLKVRCGSVCPACCAVLLSEGRGLGRSLSYVGRSQISLSVMLRAALVHKLPCEAIS